MPFISNVQDEQEKSKNFIGFPKGLNTVQDESLVNDKNVTEAQNVIIEIDGIKRRPGSERVYDTGGASYVWGMSPFYKKTTNTRNLFRVANQRLQYLVSDEWTNVSSLAFSDANANFVQARDKLFIYNGVDKLRYTNGTTITEYTAITTPVGLGVTATGTTGSNRYSYIITAFNSTGESIGSTAVTITNGNATLSSTNYNALAWTATSGATGYNIYGRTDSGFLQCYMATVYTNSYNDTGVDEPATTKPFPTENASGGIIGKYGIFTLGRQFVAGVTSGSTYYPTRIYYSGTLDRIDAFVGGEFGGGWVEIYANDGGEIVGLAPFQNGVLVLKTNGIYKFYFTSDGTPALEEITRGHGGVSFRSGQVIDNNYIYVAQKDNKLAVMTIGQQAQYVGDQLRTNDLSIFITDDLNNANRSELQNVASFYFDYKFGFTYAKQGDTENQSGYVLDTRFGGWVYWDGLPMQCTQYATYDDGDEVNLLGASNHDGYIIKLFKNETNDDGASYTSIVTTKSHNMDMFNIEKVFRNPTLWFKYISGGSIEVRIKTDGTILSGTATLSGTSSGTMVGVDLAGESLVGVSVYESTETSEGADLPQVLDILTFARTIKFSLIDSSTNSNWLFMGYNILYSPLDGKPLDDQYRVTVS